MGGRDDRRAQAAGPIRRPATLGSWPIAEAYPTDDSGYGVHPIQSFPISWAKFTWGGRVLRSKHPEVQEPGSEPFFFLAPGRSPSQAGGA